MPTNLFEQYLRKQWEIDKRQYYVDVTFDDWVFERMTPEVLIGLGNKAMEELHKKAEEILAIYGKLLK